MKLIFLAASVALAAPLMAQDMTTQTPPAGQTAPADPAADPAAAPTDQAMPADAAPAPSADPAMQQAPMAPAQTTDPTSPMAAAPTAAPAPTDPNAPPPAGGYQPSGPATTGPAAPGATVRFQQAPDPATAFPPPPPMQKYPVCKKGQYDKCIQRGGR